LSGNLTSTNEIPMEIGLKTRRSNTATPSVKRGPKRLDIVPEQFLGISGVKELTTIKQLLRLQEYLAIAQDRRPAYVRLGASVPPGKYRKTSPTSTYAVDVEGSVSVIRRIGDPRVAHRWVRNERRPWNLCRDARFAQPSRGPATNVRVVSLAVLNIAEGAQPEWLCDGLPSGLRPDKQVIRTWPCHPHRDAGGADRDFIVEGRGDWWVGRDIPDLAAIREARGRILSVEFGTLWIGDGEVVEFPAYGYADNELLPLVGRVSSDPIKYLRERLAERLRMRIRVSPASMATSESMVRAEVERAVHSVDIRTAGLSDVDALEARLAAALAAGREVSA